MKGEDGFPLSRIGVNLSKKSPQRPRPSGAKNIMLIIVNIKE
jgi:hypothetical protein